MESKDFTFPVEGSIPELVHLWCQNLTEVVECEFRLMLKARLQHQGFHQPFYLLGVWFALGKFQQGSEAESRLL